MNWPKPTNISFTTCKLLNKEEFRKFYKWYVNKTKNLWWRMITEEVLKQVDYDCIFASYFCRGPIQCHHNRKGYPHLFGESYIPGKHLVPVCRSHHQKEHFELDPFSLEKAVKNYRTGITNDYF